MLQNVIIEESDTPQIFCHLLLKFFLEISILSHLWLASRFKVTQSIKFNITLYFNLFCVTDLYAKKYAECKRQQLKRFLCDLSSDMQNVRSANKKFDFKVRPNLIFYNLTTTRLDFNVLHNKVSSFVSENVFFFL